MRSISLVIVAIILLAAPAVVAAQGTAGPAKKDEPSTSQPVLPEQRVMEVAGKCEILKSQMRELIKKSDKLDVGSLRGALGLTLLNSCDTKAGKLHCFQCIDKEERLTAVQVLWNPETGKLTFKGMGCECAKKE